MFMGIPRTLPIPPSGLSMMGRLNIQSSSCLLGRAVAEVHVDKEKTAAWSRLDTCGYYQNKWSACRRTPGRPRPRPRGRQDMLGSQPSD